MVGGAVEGVLTARQTILFSVSVSFLPLADTDHRITAEKNTY
jgi:hypothetical protein